MYGTWRLFLCLAVAHGHLHYEWWAAAYALFSFYMLSGYLATLVLNEKYGFTLDGFKRFIINRLLRIYPAYYLAAIFSVLLILVFPDDFIRSYHLRIGLPSDVKGWFLNFFVVGLKVNTSTRLVPPAWTLSIIILHYFLIGAGVGKSKTIVSLWMILSVLYHVVAVFFLKEFHWRYFSVFGATLPFAMGSFLYHYSACLEKIIPEFAKKMVLAAYIVFYIYVWRYYPNSKMMLPFYLNLILAFLLILSLKTLKKDSQYFMIDKWLDKLSFPVFLVHLQIGMMVSYFTGYKIRSVNLFLASLPFIIFAAWVMVKIIGVAVEPKRTKVSMKSISAITLKGEY